MFKVALLIDGGYIRTAATRAGKGYTPDFIEAFALSCIEEQEETLHRILYYDCPLYRGQQAKPISGEIVQFEASDSWLDDLASRNLFAVRKGTLTFRGWTLKKIRNRGRDLKDDDFKPHFVQKGVDMRIGLDIATICAERRFDRILLVSGDTDLIPALKHARRASVQVVAIQLPAPFASTLSSQLLAHIDYKRSVSLPNALSG